MALWELDEFVPGVLLGFVREVPQPNTFLGTRWLPNDTINDISFEYFLGANKRPVMAHVMGYDSEAPIHGRPGRAQKVTGELPPIKRKAKISEKEIIRFLTPRAGTTDQLEAVKQVYGTIGDLLDAIQARVEWLRLQALSEDTVIYDESGVVFEFDFGINEAFQIDLSGAAPVDGSGTDVSADGWGPNWNDPNADPVKDLQILQQMGLDTFGRKYAEFVSSSKNFRGLPNNLALKRYARGGGSANATADSAMLSPAEIQNVFDIYDLPMLVPYDVTVQRENEDGTYSDVKPLAPNKAFAVPEGFGRVSSGGEAGNSTLWGPTAESRVLYGTPQAGQAPGIWAETYGTTEPPAEWVKAAAIAFPTMPEANTLAQLTLHS